MSLIRNLTSKPWEHKGVIGGLKPEGAFDAPSEKVGLILFLVVATIVFSLFTVSYFVRMALPDWQPLSKPAQLWFNTGLLFISSAMFQWARNIVSRDSRRSLTTAFIGGGVTWGNLQNSGYYLASNPANSFYYLMTGLHALHLLGGLWVWSKSSARLISGSEPKEIKLSIELCTVYWHFLLVVWLVLFTILSNT
jgi:cytochrome c oxidase subunit 3